MLNHHCTVSTIQHFVISIRSAANACSNCHKCSKCATTLYHWFADSVQ